MFVHVNKQQAAEIERKNLIARRRVTAGRNLLGLLGGLLGGLLLGLLLLRLRRAGRAGGFFLGGLLGGLRLGLLLLRRAGGLRLRLRLRLRARRLLLGSLLLGLLLLRLRGLGEVRTGRFLLGSLLRLLLLRLRRAGGLRRARGLLLSSLLGLLLLRLGGLGEVRAGRLLLGSLLGLLGLLLLRLGLRLGRARGLLLALLALLLRLLLLRLRLRRAGRAGRARGLLLALLGLLALLLGLLLRLRIGIRILIRLLLLVGVNLTTEDHIEGTHHRAEHLDDIVVVSAGHIHSIDGNDVVVRLDQTTALSLQLGVARTVVETLDLAHSRLVGVGLVEVQTERTVHELHLHLHELLAEIAVNDLTVLVNTLLGLRDGAGVHHLAEHRPVLDGEVVHGGQQSGRAVGDDLGDVLLNLAANDAIHPLQHGVQHSSVFVVLHLDVQGLQLQVGVLDLELGLLVHHAELEGNSEHGIIGLAIDGGLTLVLGEGGLVDLEVDLLHLDLQVADTHTKLSAIDLATVENEANKHYLL